MSAFSTLQGEAPDTRKRYTLQSAREFERPTLAWLIEDLFPETGLLCIYGASGSGKSMYSISMAAAVADGADWFGHRTNRHQVVYVALEGQMGIPARVAAWERHHEQPYPDDVKFVFDPFALNRQDDVTALVQAILRCEGVGLIIIDTLNKAASGADENSSSEMGHLLTGATALQKQTGAAVLLIHHPGKDSNRGLRGHSSLHAALDAVVEIERDGRRNRWTLIKAKDGQEGIGNTFELVVVEIETTESGKPATSCAVRPVEGGTFAPKQREPNGTNQKTVLNAFEQLWVEMKVAYTGRDQEWPSGIPFEDAIQKIKNELINVDTNHRQARAKEALERLVQMGFLIRDDDLLSFPSE